VAEVHGTCDKRFDAVRVALAESLDDADVGASAAVFVDGEPVADLRGGYKDAKRYGLGYGIFDPACGWGGWGGSLVMVDLDARMTVAYVMNQMLQPGSGDSRGLGIVLAAYDGLG
jgi:CubicO group peptidase (beta-lactamase class C family)